MSSNTRVCVTEKNKDDFMVVLYICGWEWMQNPPAVRHCSREEADKLSREVAQNLNVDVEWKVEVSVENPRRWRWFGWLRR